MISILERLSAIEETLNPFKLSAINKKNLENEIIIEMQKDIELIKNVLGLIKEGL